MDLYPILIQVSHMDTTDLDELQAAITVGRRILNSRQEVEVLGSLHQGDEVEFLETTKPKKYIGLRGKFVGFRGRKLSIQLSNGAIINSPASILRKVTS
jgi:hypothetical protein